MDKILHHWTNSCTTGQTPAPLGGRFVPVFLGFHPSPLVRKAFCPLWAFAFQSTPSKGGLRDHSEALNPFWHNPPPFGGNIF